MVAHRRRRWTSLLGDRTLGALSALAVARLVWLGVRIRSSDLNLDYPWLAGDSWDWIANGLWIGGADVRYSARPPLLPLAIAGLDRIGLLTLLPIALQVLLQITILVLFVVARRRWGSGPALTAALVLALSDSLQGASLDLMADVPAACLLFLAVAAALRADEQPSFWIWSGIAAAASALTQQSGLLWLPAVLLAALVVDPSLFRRRQFILGLIAFTIPQAIWLAWKLARFGTAGDVLLRQWDLVHPHLADVAGAAWRLTSILGAPAACLAVFGALRCLHRIAGAPRTTKARVGRMATILLVLAHGSFYAVLYEFPAMRLLLFLAFPAALAVAAGLGSLDSSVVGAGTPRARRAARWALAGLAVTTALPLPPAGHDGRAIAFWPLPALIAQAGTVPSADGSARLQVTDSTWLLPTLGELVAWSLPARVTRSTEDQRPPAAVPILERSDDSVVYLAAPGEETDRYRLTTRLGNALRRRVKLIPASSFLRQASALGVTLQRISSDTAGAALWRLHLPNSTRTWIVATAADLRAAAIRTELDQLQPAEPGAASPTISLARELLAAVDGSDTYLAIVPSPDAASPLPLALTLLSTSNGLFLYGHTERAAGLAEATKSSPRVETRLGPARIHRTRVFGRPSAWVILETETDPGM